MNLCVDVQGYYYYHNIHPCISTQRLIPVLCINILKINYNKYTFYNKIKNIQVFIQIQHQYRIKHQIHIEIL